MSEPLLSQQISFIAARAHEEESTVLARALHTGVSVLYRQALIESFLLGDISREQLVAVIGEAETVDVEDQRDAFRKDITWALGDG